MSAIVLGEAIGLALKILGPSIVDRTRRAVAEAGGKFSSDWRRSLYVRKELRRAIRSEARILRVPRSVQRWLVELLVMESRGRNGLPLVYTRPAA